MAPGLSWIVTDPQVRDLYENRPGLVAFVDESYRTIPQVGSIYLMTAVIADTRDLNDYRRTLVQGIGSNTFHAAPDQHRNPQGRDNIDIINALTAQRSPTLASVYLGHDNLNNETVNIRIRHGVLRSLAIELHHTYGVDTIIADHLFDARRHRHDDAAIAQARQTTRADIQLLHSHPGREQMLWAADATAWAIQHDLATPAPRNWENRTGILGDALTIMNAHTRRTMARPVAPAPDTPQKYPLLRQALRTQASATIAAQARAAEQHCREMDHKRRRRAAENARQRRPRIGGGRARRLKPR
ncbi:hypothetical protein [Cutibacterium sp.]|uniref:hypothetical protein n=1 Tax=Cutibacterium sp. TaxID=1912221 RepID=UPI0026DC953F|nr:hypothetical protein [Cutibacterium sp.]MDO4411984.1 hypothetical protein [Cutibacterium sp.]